MKKIFRWLTLSLVAGAGIYVVAGTLATRSHWPGLFWEVYLEPLPEIDVVKTPTMILQRHAQYVAASDFILSRSRTPSTAKFCSFIQADWGTERKTGREVMAGYVDMQNSFGAMIRGRFVARFDKARPQAVESVQWVDEEGTVWK